MGKSRDLAKLGGTVNSSGEVPTAGIANSAVTTDKIAANAVVTADIADSAVTTAKIANANVTVAKISATGTPSSTTFLAGDGSWQAVSSTPTTAQVLTATAGATAGAVGTYAFLAPNQNVAVGNTVAGSNCRYASGNTYYGPTNFNYAGGAPSGTWRVMSYVYIQNSCGYTYCWATLMLRIS